MATHETPTCDVEELRTLFLFENLAEDQLAWLCRHGRVEWFEPGYLYDENDLVTPLYVLLEGELVISRRVGGEHIEINKTSRAGSYAGAWRTFFGDRVGTALDDTLRVTRPSRLYVLAPDKFSELMHKWFPMPGHMFEGLFRGMKATQEAISQRERLLALGSLAAGLTHELNNPAAAATRATAALREHISELRRTPDASSSAGAGSPQFRELVKLEELALNQVFAARSASPLEAADQEDELNEWLDEHGITDGWRIAPSLVQAALTVDWLDAVAATTGDDPALGNFLHQLSHIIEIELLVGEIDDASTRISALVTAAQHYSQMDRAQYREVDVHELLDSTLLMLNSRIADNVTVVKEYDCGLPAIPLYAAEMNQVWTNLIDNALDAMGGSGTLTVRTSRDYDRLLVEVSDTGVGVPAEVQHRIFEPFFTTKPVGSGTGLGLDVSWRIVVGKHGGDLSVESAPGNTRFMVRLPLSAPEPDETP
ncbi:ATP-binding protein [Amycolatopsis sp. NPDC004368]